MTDIPIIFSAPMIQALLDGRKTMTRRLAWRAAKPTRWQRVKPGDRLWVKERFHVRPIASAIHAYSYFDEEDVSILGGWKQVRLLPHDHMVKRPRRPVWKSSIHMPREFSRLTLIVTAKKIEPLHDIDHKEALAEGTTARAEFARYWMTLHGGESWNVNPEIVALTFTVHKQNIDAMREAA